MAFQNELARGVFPGFTHRGAVSPQVREAVVTFNAESLGALESIPEKSVAWADVGSRVTQGYFDAKIPIRLPSSMSYKQFDGNRSFNKLDIAAPEVQSTPYDLNYEWEMIFEQSGNVQLKDFYGLSGVAQLMVEAGRAHKAQLVASLIYSGFTNAVIGTTAKSLTIPQPGLPNGLPLFSDGTETPLHYSHPFNAKSGRFPSLYYGAGKITDQDVFGKMMVDFTQVPHPSMPNMNLGRPLTDVIGPTHMLIPFYKTAIQQLALETTTTPGNLAGATTNIYSPERLQSAQAAQFTGASGLAPWRFWIAPQLDNHPYLEWFASENPGSPLPQMWMGVSRQEGSTRDTWAELMAASPDFTPQVTFFGDADPTSISLRKVRMLSDLDAGVAAGLPHFVKMYLETTPA